MPEQPPPDVWDEALATGRSMFTLACATAGVPDPLPGREQDLVDMALQAGVLGALSPGEEPERQ